jgi:hypothetical protein
MEGIGEDIDRGEAEAAGRAPGPVLAGREEPAALPAAVGPDPFLEALNKGKAKPEPEAIPVEAEVVELHGKLPPSDRAQEEIEAKLDEREEERAGDDDDRGDLFG